MRHFLAPRSSACPLTSVLTLLTPQYVGQGFGICGQLAGHVDYFVNNIVVQDNDGNYANGACSGAGKTVVGNNTVRRLVAEREWWFVWQPLTPTLRSPMPPARPSPCRSTRPPALSRSAARASPRGRRRATTRARRITPTPS